MSGTVGAFPNLLAKINRQTIRAKPNPTDLSTIISIYPKRIKVKNITLQPGRWTIEPGTAENPSFLVVGSSSWWKEVNPDEPLLEIPVSSLQVADSIVNDKLNGMFGCDMGESRPGLFYIPGKVDLKILKEQHSDILALAINRQKNFYLNLVKFADSLWARSNGNPLVITNSMRNAAKTLGLQDKDWLKDYNMSGQVRCKACGVLKDPNYPVCHSCRAIDMGAPGAKDIKFAAQ